MRSRDIIRPLRRQFLRRKIKSFVWKSVFAVFVLIAAIALLSWGSRNEKFLVSGVKIEGNETVSAEEISKIAERELFGKYVFLFPKNNIFIYPGSSIAGEIIRSLKKVKSVETKIGDGNELVVKILERKPSYIWCPEQEVKKDPESAGQCYFLDERGFSFSEAPRFSAPVFFEIHYGFMTDAGVGGYPFEDLLFRKLILFKNALEEISLPAIRLIKMKDGDFKFELKDGGAILINEKNDITVSLRNLVSAKKALDDSGKATSSLEYIDLRFGNKVFFKSK